MVLVYRNQGIVYIWPVNLEGGGFKPRFICIIKIQNGKWILGGFSEAKSF